MLIKHLQEQHYQQYMQYYVQQQAKQQSQPNPPAESPDEGKTNEEETESEDDVSESNCPSKHGTLLLLSGLFSRILLLTRSQSRNLKKIS